MASRNRSSIGLAPGVAIPVTTAGETLAGSAARPALFATINATAVVPQISKVFVVIVLFRFLGRMLSPFRHLNKERLP